MLKSLTFSVSLAVALGFASVSMAGGHGCTTCGLASPQGTVASPQSVVASPQSCDTCGIKKHSFKMPKISLPKFQHTTSYEYVLKKKHHFAFAKGCGEAAPAAIYPTSQVAPTVSPQAVTPMPAAQHSYLSLPGEMKPALAADEVPPAPTIASGRSLLQLTPSGN